MNTQANGIPSENIHGLYSMRWDGSLEIHTNKIPSQNIKSILLSHRLM